MNNHNKTWFSTWPPKTYREGHDDMNNRRGFLRRFRSWRLIAGIVSIGLIGVLLISLGIVIYPEHGTISDISKEIGAILLVAAIFGVLVEAAFMHEIATNVFRAVLGHVFPEELSDEVRWIYGQTLMAEKHNQVVRLRLSENMRFVHLECETRRTLKNLTDDVQHFRFEYAIDDWQIEGIPSEFTRFAYCINYGEWQPVKVANAELSRGELRLSNPETIRINPNDLLQVQIFYREAKRANDALYTSFGQPTKEPELIVYADDKLSYRTWFGHRNQPLDKPNSGDTFTLPDTLLPTQNIVVRWWPKDESANTNPTD